MNFEPEPMFNVKEIRKAKTMTKTKTSVTKWVILALILFAGIPMIKTLRAKAFFQHRNDVTGTIDSTNGTPWGNWRQPVYCPNDTFARGIAQKVEGNQGTGDDTALNNVKLYCVDRQGTAKGEIAPEGGPWGRWGSSGNCASGKFLSGFKLKVEGSQGNGDDTGVNSMFVQCNDDSSFEVANGGQWGSWGTMQICPAGSAICGVALKVETPLGDRGDDTAVNNVKCYCCKL